MCNYEWKNILLWRNCYFYTGTFILSCNYYGEILIILSEDLFFLFCDGTTLSQKIENFIIFIDFVTGFTFCDDIKLSQKIEILIFKI